MHVRFFLFLTVALAFVSGGNVRSERLRPYDDQPFAETSTKASRKSGTSETPEKIKSSHGEMSTSNPIDGSDAKKMSKSANLTWDVENVERRSQLTDFVVEGSTCRLRTEDLMATAEASVARALKGLCNSHDLEERFEYLESSLLKQLSTLRNMILNLEKRLGEHGDAVLYGQKQLSSAILKSCSGTNGYPPSGDVNNKNQKSGTGGRDVDGDDSVPESAVSGVRDPEILKFNSSIHTETSATGSGPKKVFTYYWRIKDMTYKLSGWNPWKSFRSQSFYVFPSGYRMYMRVFPRQNEDSFNVRVGVTKGEFDESLKWPFPLRHKIHILDQTKDDKVFEDIASRIWDPNLLCSDFNWQKPVKGDNHECIEVAFPHDVLRQREYIRRDALVIKLTVYLES